MPPPLPNLDVKVVGQPDAAKLEKDSAVHFTGTLVAFDPDPAFMLHWDKAKVKEEDLPKANAPAKKPAAAASSSQEADSVKSKFYEMQKTALRFGGPFLFRLAETCA